MSLELEDMAVEAGEHGVVFYESDAQLNRTVGVYLRRAIEERAIAIVIATAAHRRVFAAELEAEGLNPDALLADGTLRFLDAAATLAEFVSEGQVDKAGFRRVVGSLVRTAAETGRPVWAYGEMVGLLWDAGDVLAAIELERAWNDLSHELPFALLCGYRGESVQGSSQKEALQEVCHLHSSVLRQSSSGDPDASPAAPEVSAHFRAERTAPCEARRFVAAALTDLGQTDTVVQDAQLVVSELATNAVIHARSAFSVTLVVEGPNIQLAVEDGCPLKPALRDAGAEATSGHGLHLVDSLGADWGVEPAFDGKTVWVRLTA